MDVSSSGVSATDSANDIMWIDQNDSFNSLLSVMPKDLNNIVHGVQTYGFSESLIYTETAIFDLWLMFADDLGMGLGFGLLGSAFITRLVFIPTTVYSVSFYSFQ